MIMKTILTFKRQNEMYPGEQQNVVEQQMAMNLPEQCNKLDGK